MSDTDNDGIRPLREIYRQDPSALTIEMVLRELVSLEKRIDARLDGADRATALFQENLTRVPTDVDKAINNVKEFYSETIAGLRSEIMEKFRGIGVQISERDTQSERKDRDSKVAIDAALSAQKEAVNEQNKSNALANAKTENSFTKQIEQLGDLVRTLTGAMNDKIDDLKARMTMIESHGKGVGDSWGYLVGAIGAAAAIVVVIIDLLHR